MNASPPLEVACMRCGLRVGLRVSESASDALYGAGWRHDFTNGWRCPECANEASEAPPGSLPPAPRPRRPPAKPRS